MHLFGFEAKLFCRFVLSLLTAMGIGAICVNPRYLRMFQVVGEKQSRSRTSTAPARAEYLIATIATTSCHETIPHGFYRIMKTFVDQGHHRAKSDRSRSLD